MVRIKTRYLLCHIDAAPRNKEKVSKLSERNIINSVRASVAHNFGDLVMGQVSTSIICKLWSPALSLCLIRCAREHFRKVWAAITMLSTLHSTVDIGNICCTVIHIGGTIRSCQKSAFAYARQLILEARVSRNETAILEVAFSALQREMHEKA